jgi:hypothetical protein
LGEENILTMLAIIQLKNSLFHHLFFKILKTMIHTMFIYFCKNNFATCLVWNMISHIEGTIYLQMFENKVLREVFESERNEVSMQFSILHN